MIIIYWFYDFIIDIRRVYSTSALKCRMDIAIANLTLQLFKTIFLYIISLCRCMTNCIYYIYKKTKTAGINTFVHGLRRVILFTRYDIKKSS